MRLPVFIAFPAIFLLAALAVFASRHLSVHPSTALDVDVVLAWRLQFEDLIGKDEGTVIERLGAADRTTSNWIGYLPSAKTGSHKIDFLIENGRIAGVKVFPRPEDALQIDKVLQRAPVFCFSVGTYTDSTIEYLKAQSMDGRNTLQFSLGGRSIVFHAVMFRNEGPSCDPNAVAPYR